MGAGWGRDLTPSAVRAVEAELGEACRPSIDRLKRRVGLLPLRKRPREYYILINGGHLADPAAANGSGPDTANGRSANGGSSTSTSTLSSSSSSDSEAAGMQHPSFF
ncbi:chitin synthase D [Chlorella sorokiniana]|uniref:Chitin synthase D n=1 Tax=Chlorella sorokiniana TaxID=3076 RepID=A0A2P6TM65_CHLSO|nr:chitin synthase D [Chlorella sorokiniana]|eukprot:PRW45419.1 chitin synthase D [Chlorella sorokiniana]